MKSTVFSTFMILYSKMKNIGTLCIERTCKYNVCAMYMYITMCSAHFSSNLELLILILLDCYVFIGKHCVCTHMIILYWWLSILMHFSYIASDRIQSVSWLQVNKKFICKRRCSSLLDTTFQTFFFHLFFCVPPLETSITCSLPDVPIFVLIVFVSPKIR